MLKIMSDKIIKYWKPILIAIVICYGSLTSSSNLNKVNFLTFQNIDKLIHFLMYAALSLLFLIALRKNSRFKRKEQIIITLILVISYGLIMEVFQFYFTNDRSAELIDAFANILGSLFGLLIFPIFYKFNLIKYL